MDYEEMKLECLRLAISAGHKGQDAIEMAAKFYDHCRGRSGKTENMHVTVHGKDSDLGKFTDYVRDPNSKF